MFILKIAQAYVKKINELDEIQWNGIAQSV
jgi:hypothetical protein